MDYAVRDVADAGAPAPDEAALAVLGTPDTDLAVLAPPDAARPGPAVVEPLFDAPAPAIASLVAPVSPPEPALDAMLDHDGPWSEEDYRALSAKSVAQGDGRAELIDGALVIGPGPTLASDTVVAYVRSAIEAALPEGLSVLAAVPIHLGIDCVLVPDMVVTRTPPDPASPADTPLAAEEVLMVVEVIGPEHGALDRSFKPQVYARSRVPYLLLVDHHTPAAAASMVIGGRYHEYARAFGPDELQLEEPFRLRLPLRPGHSESHDPV